MGPAVVCRSLLFLLACWCRLHITLHSYSVALTPRRVTFCQWSPSWQRISMSLLLILPISHGFDSVALRSPWRLFSLCRLLPGRPLLNGRQTSTSLPTDWRRRPVQTTSSLSIRGHSEFLSTGTTTVRPAGSLSLTSATTASIGTI